MVDDIPFPKRIRLPHEAYANREHVFHLVMRAAPRTVPFRGRVRDVVWAAIQGERQRGSVDLLAVCLMPDHLHVVAKPANLSLIAWAQRFKSYSTHVARKAGAGPHLWQPGFWDRRLRIGELGQAIEYVRNNPVAAGLLSGEDEWRWTWWDEEAE